MTTQSPFSTPEMLNLQNELREQAKQDRPKPSAPKKPRTSPKPEKDILVTELFATQTFKRKPQTVQAIQITAENMDDVTKWCGGKVVIPENEERYIEVPVHNPRSPRLGQGHVGDWVVVQKVRLKKTAQRYESKEVDTFRVFPDVSFRKEFDDASLDSPAKMSYDPGTPIFDAVMTQVKMGLLTQDSRTYNDAGGSLDELARDTTMRVFEVINPLTPKDGVNVSRPA